LHSKLPLKPLGLGPAASAFLVPNLEVDIQGMDDTTVRLRALGGNTKDELRRVIRNGSVIGLASMKARVPKSRENKKYGNYKAGHEMTVEKSLRMKPIEYKPGGLGGGGVHEGGFGPGDNAPEHLDYLTADTDSIGRGGNLAGKRMFMRSVFGKQTHPTLGKGRWISRRKGYRAKTEWITISQQLANRQIAKDIRELNLDK
jgi:hypothetical protein